MNRLDTICSMIDKNLCVYDIGTDHAYLLLKLYPKLKQGFALDIAKKPLELAKRTIIDNNLDDKVTAILSNGLEKVDFNIADVIVIAGMGGELICDILKNAHKKVTFILQPMTKPQELYFYLKQNNFAVIDAKIVQEDRRFYIIFKCENFANYNFCKHYFEEKVLKNQPLYKQYINFLIDKNEKIIKKITYDNSEKYNNVKNILLKLKECLDD